MSRPHASSSDARARMAIVGPTGTIGDALREALSRVGIPSSAVNLFGESIDEGAEISEYAGEARLIQPPDLTEIVGHDLVFLCERGTTGRKLCAMAPKTLPLIDLVDCLADGSTDDTPPPLVHAKINPEAVRGLRGPIRVAHPLASILAELLHTLETNLGLEEVLAVVLRPAADFGRRGVEELRDQTVRLLSFAELPVETFGRQLTFNILTEVPVSDRLESRVVTDVTGLLGWPSPRLSVKLLVAPVFYGHSIQIRFRTTHDASVDAVMEVLASGPFGEAVAAQESVTPMDVTGDSGSKIGLSRPAPDGLGGYWLNLVVGGIETRWAGHVVELAGLLVDA